MDFICLNIRKR